MTDPKCGTTTITPTDRRSTLSSHTAAEPIEARRRRLEADIADAKKTLNRAQWHFDSLCNELAALRREEMEAPAPATDPLAVTLDETHLWAVAKLAPGQALTVTAPPCVADVIGKEDRPWVIVTFDDFGVRPTFIRTRQFVAAHFTGPFAVELDAAAKEIDADPTGPQVARVVFEPRGVKRKPTWHAIGHELVGQNVEA
jgi:hypothetical protein